MVLAINKSIKSPYLRTAVVGASGFAGIEVIRLLAAHPVFALSSLHAGSKKGTKAIDLWPQLATIPDLADSVFLDSEPESLEGADVVFLATPADIAANLGGQLVKQGSLVIDLSGGHRLSPENMDSWYHIDHPHKDLLPGVYGLPELDEGKIAGSKIVAGPGCFPTAALLAVAPFLQDIESSSIVVNGLSGVSGAGKSADPRFTMAQGVDNVRPYGSPHHRHTAEIERILGELTGEDFPPITFTPHISSTVRGLLATVTATVKDSSNIGNPLDKITEFYDKKPFVYTYHEWPETKTVIGTNNAIVHAQYDERTGRITTSCAIDNMVKGAAGQAIQAANIALGLPEVTGLETFPTYI